MRRVAINEAIKDDNARDIQWYDENHRGVRLVLIFLRGSLAQRLE